ACRVGRHRPAVQHLLWLVMLLKFLTPPLITWPWSLQDLRETVWESPTTSTAANNTAAISPPANEVVASTAAEFEVGLPFLESSSMEYTIAPSPRIGEGMPSVGSIWPITAWRVLLAGWLCGAVISAWVQLRLIVQHAKL